MASPLYMLSQPASSSTPPSQTNVLDSFDSESLCSAASSAVVSASFSFNHQQHVSVMVPTSAKITVAPARSTKPICASQPCRALKSSPPQAQWPNRGNSTTPVIAPNDSSACQRQRCRKGAATNVATAPAVNH
jgi:hypothetical protein